MREFVRVFDDCFNRFVVADIKCLGDDRGYFTYDFPDSLAYGQLLRLLTYISEQSANCLIIGESTGNGEYVVLQERNCGVGDLRRKITGLAFTKSEVLLAVLENHLDRPSHGIDFICFVKVKGCVSGQHPAPRGSLVTAHIEEPHGYVVDKSIHNDIIAAMVSAVSQSFGFCLPFCNDGLGRCFFATPDHRKPHAFFAHFNHAEVITFYVPCLDEPDDFFACKPAVSQQIIKAVTILYGTLDHLLEKFNLTFYIVIGPLGRCTVLIPFFGESAFEFGFRQGMAAILPGLSNNLKINDHLGLFVAYGQNERLEAQYHLMGDMAEDAANLFGMNAPFGIIGIVHNQVYWATRVVGSHVYAPPELSGYMVHDFAPVKGVVIHESIEHIFRRAA